MRIGKFVQQENDFYRAEGTNICGILVHARAEKADRVAAALSEMQGVEVVQREPDGRMIVLVEDTEDEWAGQILTRFPTIEGVLSASLAYHHCEAGDLEKEFVG